MSFFGALGKILQGKPVFEPDQKQQPSLPGHQPAPVAQAPQPAHGGPKVLPRVFIDETQTRMNGQRMDCYGMIRNDSPRHILLDKVRIMGTVRELDTTLRPGERRQFLLYSGNRPHSSHEHECEVWYRDETGDYFSGLHDVQLQKQSDGSFTVVHIHYHGIRDI